MWNDWQSIATITALVLFFLALFAFSFVLHSAFEQYMVDELRKLGLSDEQIANHLQQAEIEARQYNQFGNYGF